MQQPDWSRAREDLLCTLESASPRRGVTSDGGLGADADFWGVPVLVVIPVKDSVLQRDGRVEESATSNGIRERILADAWEGLRLTAVAERGFSFRVTLVGLHEFESRSKAAAASGEGLVFAGGLEEACSQDVAAKLAELAGLTFTCPMRVRSCVLGVTCGTACSINTLGALPFVCPPCSVLCADMFCLLPDET